MEHKALIGGPEGNWEMDTRDTGTYVSMSDVISYFDWLGDQVSDSADRRTRIQAHERGPTDARVHSTGNLAGLADRHCVLIIGGADNPAREGLVSIAVEGLSSPDLVTALRSRGIRTHTRKADHYSGNFLDPLRLPDAVRVSMCRYNILDEVKTFLAAMREILDG